MIPEESHITPQEAAEHLLDEAAKLHTPARSPQVKVSLEYLRQLKLRSDAGAEERRQRGDPIAANRPETPDALIGYLADAPEVAQTIREMAYERRSINYGT